MLLQAALTWKQHYGRGEMPGPLHFDANPPSRLTYCPHRLGSVYDTTVVGYYVRGYLY